MLIRGYVTENTKLLCYLSSSVVGDRIFIPSDVILQCSRAVPLLSSTFFSPCFDIAAFFCRSQVLFLIAGYFSARLPSKGSIDVFERQLQLGLLPKIRFAIHLPAQIVVYFYEFFRSKFKFSCQFKILTQPHFSVCRRQVSPCPLFFAAFLEGKARKRSHQEGTPRKKPRPFAATGMKPVKMGQESI